MSRQSQAYWHHYQLGLIHKYQAGPAWEAHLMRTRSMLIDYVQHRNLHRLAITGSGWLLDVPMEQLLPMLDYLELIDISHPRQVLLRWQKHSKVYFTSLDVTLGTVDEVLRLMRARKSVDDLEKLLDSAPMPQLAHDVEGVVSLNLLSQLPLRLLDDTNPHYTSEQRQHLAAMVQKRHLDWLGILPSALIVTDFEETCFPLKPSHEEVPRVRPTVFTPLPQLAHRARWPWELDSQGITYDGYRTVLSVVGGELSQEAIPRL